MSIIVNFCPTGMIPTKELNSSVPISPQEIIEQTHEANEIGISIAHLHARLENQKPTYKASIYAEIMEGLRKFCPQLIICLSTSGRDFPEFEKRSEVIELKPDMCSLTLSSLNFINQASINPPQMVQNLFEKMLEYGVHPELECFDLGMINYGKYLINKYKVTKRCYWNLIYGNIAGLQPSFLQLGTALSEIPNKDLVTLGGIGNTQLAVNSLAIAAGYGVRIGLEDNIWYNQRKTKPATNISLLKRVHKLIEVNEKEFMPSKEINLYNENYKYSRI